MSSCDALLSSCNDQARADERRCEVVGFPFEKQTHRRWTSKQRAASGERRVGGEEGKETPRRNGQTREQCGSLRLAPLTHSLAWLVDECDRMYVPAGHPRTATTDTRP